MTRLRPVALAVALATCLLLGATRPAQAKSVHDSRYTYQQTFGTALRLIKVDLGLQVTESNDEWGYLIFVYVHPESGKRKNRGSISFVKGEEFIQVTVQLPEMPSYHERFILQRLRRKLEQEHGEPAKREKEPPPDRDEDEDEDEDGKDDEPPADGAPKRR